MTCKSATYVLLLLLSGLSACKKQDHYYREFIEDGEKVYAGKLQQLTALAGHNRIVLSGRLPADPNLRSAKVYWNGFQDSLEVPIPAQKIGDTMQIALALDEGSYQFQVFTFNAMGHRSVKAETEGSAYGDRYIETLLPRLLGEAAFVHNQLSLSWLGADQTAIGTEVSYINNTGLQKTMIVPPGVTDTVVADYQPGTVFKYRTLFKPEARAIDTFYTDYEEASLDIRHYEDVVLNKDRFVEFRLPGDASPWTGSGNRMSSLWSGILSGNQSAGAWYRTNNGSGIPHHFQFDLGVTAKLTSYRLWQRGTVNEHHLLYDNGNLRRWEIWGSTEPAEDGSYDGWIKLLDCEIVKPSGTPAGTTTAEDIAAAQTGHEFMFDNSLPNVRYIRINVLETWGQTDYMFASELTFRGSYWGQED
ncbi:protein of unknown function [Parapedobacter composti]|uniref:DUF5000 domain-containing protein n=1 Tax=Parapedobacter composti TaxID=623281 RepID=A0A1I1I9H1_9SPHI|nr:DUF4998 domain-containing protein [Parapedobacter composti]SFC32402.1 protein of unknown function [Parapedobacter composti]